MKSLSYSVLSGFFASLASLSGKFAMGNDDMLWLCEVSCGYWFGESSVTTVNHFPACRNFLVYLRVVFFVIMILLNGLMGTTFVKALRYSRTSVEAMVTNTAANFFFTAIFSRVLFGEFLTLVWWVGTLFILFGILLMHEGHRREALPIRKKRS